jgi:hypothetical protein
MSMKYIGAGSFLISVPARDLSDAEVEIFGAQLREMLDKNDERVKLSNADLLQSTGLYAPAEVETPISTRNSKKKESDV